MIESLPILLTAKQSQEGKLANSVVSRMPTTLGDIDNLSQALTIGGTDYAPCAYLVADDINPSTGAWASRHNAAKALSVAGSGAAPTYGNQSAISNTSVKYSATKYHQAADTTWGQVTTGDFAFECVATVTTGTEVIAASRVQAALMGWEIFLSSATIAAYIGDADSFVTVAGPIIYISSPIVHFMAFVDRSHELFVYVNGVYSGISSGLSGITGDLTSGGGIGVGAFSGGTTPYSGSLLHVAVWDLPTNPWPGAATNQAVMGAIAAERFATITGINCSKNTTYSFARASSAYVDRYTTSTVRSLFSVSVGWPRVCERKDVDGNTVAGYLSELQYTNDFLYSEDATQWAQVRCTISSNAAVAPDGTTTADGIISDAGNNTHYVNLECAADVSQHVFSCWLKAGAQNWARMDIHTQANAYVYFDISASAGAIGTVGADITSHGIEPWGNGWYRCWIEYTGAAPAHDHHIHTCVANDGQTWDSPGGVVDLYVWGAQHESAGSVLPTSYIKTAAAAATRIKDSLVRVVPTIGTGKVFAKCTTLLGPSHNSTQSKTIFAVDNITS